jgi:hypothetical protein
VTASFFQMFGARVIYGRAFTDAEDHPGGSRVALIGRGLWVRRFGGDPLALGKSLTLGGQTYTLIGILDTFDPEQFDQVPDMWIPFQIDSETQDRGGEFCFVTAHLKPGVTIGQAAAQLANAADAYRQRYPRRAAPRSEFAVLPLRDAIVARRSARSARGSSVSCSPRTSSCR